MKPTERMAEKRAELFEDLVDHTTKLLRDYGTPDKASDLIANQLADYLADTWGGQNINIPKDYQRKLVARELDLYGRFTGENHAELARDFGMTERGVYKLIRRVRERLRRNAQNAPQLFDTA